jgi:hypothetical protein
MALVESFIVQCRSLRWRTATQKPSVVRTSVMANQLADRCPNCDLILLSGAIFDASAKSDEFGPILGLSRDVNPDDARAGYVGISSLWLGDDPNSRHLYRCPRCQTDCLSASDV